MGIKGGKQAVGRLRALSKGADRYLGPALFAGGELIQVDAQNSITRGSASGTSGGKHQHIPSRPGEPPNNFTGVLANNIETVSVAPLTVHVTSNAPYSAALEFGTSKMEARPFMRPARDRNKAAVKKMVDDAFGRFVASTKQGAK